MGEINKKKIEELKAVLSSKEEWKKSIKIVKDKKQYRVSIPRKFADLLNINERTDYMEFHLIPDENTEQGFKLEASFVRHG